MRTTVVKGAGDYYEEGNTIKVECAEGFKLVNGRSKSRYRCKGGLWKPSRPQCVVRDCSRPEVHHAEVREVNGSQVSLSVTCHSGYRLKGPANIVCNLGRWQPNIPVCLGVPCHLPKIKHGSYFRHRPGDTVAHDTLLEYSCSPGLARGHTRPVQCKTGSIVPSLPVCVEDLTEIKPEPFNLRQNEEPRVESPEDPINAPGSWPSFDESKACSPPEEILGGGLMFMSRQEEEEQEEEEEEEVTDYNMITAEEEEETDLDSFRDVLQGEREVGEEGEEGESYFQDLYPNGTVIRFQCSQTSPSQYASWQISCEAGVWLGSHSPCSPAGNTLEEIRAAGYRMPCLFSPPEEASRLVAFYQGRQVRADITIPADQSVSLRCSDIGKFRLEGPSRRRCLGGYFEGRSTRCVGLNQEHDYKLGHPPTVLFRHEGGPIAQSNQGELLVFPGTTLHMECLFLKRFGTPTWSSRRAGRENYPQGWAQGPDRDATLEYRLSIFQAEVRDTGEFTCTTPTKQAHSINIIVANITCPPISLTAGLVASTDSTILNTRVEFLCNNGNSLLGPASLTCLPTGQWTEVQPACQQIFCPDLREVLGDTKVLVDTETHEAGGVVRFRCPLNYELVGPQGAQCAPDGSWSLGPRRPSCVPVLCQSPPTPEHGTVVPRHPGQTTYRVGDIVQFHCEPGFLMSGSPVSACTLAKTWSLPPPQCVTACTYPGTGPGANIHLVKFYYNTGETVRFSCEPGLELVGPPLLKCLDTGHWSGGVPACRQL